MRRKLLAASLVLLVGVVLLGIARLRGCGKKDPFAPPAPDAPDAPDWTTGEANPAGNEKRAEEPSEDPHGRYDTEDPSRTGNEKRAEEPSKDPHGSYDTEDPNRTGNEKRAEEPSEDPHGRYDTEDPSRTGNEKRAEEPSEDLHAKYGWPADFKLPLTIIIDDLPEVPKGIMGRWPPIQQE